MKVTTQKQIWDLYHQLDATMPDDTDMSVFADRMRALALELGDPIPVGVDEEFFEAINSVGAFRSFKCFSSEIDKVFESL
jgi:hypothetical protein